MKLEGWKSENQVQPYPADDDLTENMVLKVEKRLSLPEKKGATWSPENNKRCHCCFGPEAWLAGVMKHVEKGDPKRNTSVSLSERGGQFSKRLKS